MRSLLGPDGLDITVGNVKVTQDLFLVAASLVKGLMLGAGNSKTKNPRIWSTIFGKEPKFAYKKVHGACLGLGGKRSVGPGELTLGGSLPNCPLPLPLGPPLAQSVALPVLRLPVVRVWVRHTSALNIGVRAPFPRRRWPAVDDDPYIKKVETKSHLKSDTLAVETTQSNTPPRGKSKEVQNLPFPRSEWFKTTHVSRC